jgi:hypothetical protein
MGEILSFRQRPGGYTLFVRDGSSTANPRNTESVFSWASLIDSVISVHVGRSRTDLWCIKFMRKFGAQKALRAFNKGGDRPFGEGASAFLGTKPSLENRDAPMAAAQCIEQLNSFAPLQWSNTLEICNVTRFCKKRPREPEQPSLEAFVAEQIASLQSLHPHILQPTLALSNGSLSVIDGVSSLLVDEEKIPESAGGLDAIENPTTETARQNKISANLMANAELGILSLTEFEAKNRLQPRHQINCRQEIYKKPCPTKFALTSPNPAKGPDYVTRPCVFIRQSISFYNPDGSEIVAAGAGGCSCRYRGIEKEPSVYHLPAGDVLKAEFMSRFSVFGSSAIPATPSLSVEEDTGPLPMSQQMSQPDYSTRDVATVKKLRSCGTLKSRTWKAEEMNQGLPIKFTSSEAFRMALLGFDLLLAPQPSPSSLSSCCFPRSSARPIATKALEKALEESQWEDAAKGIFQ